MKKNSKKLVPLALALLISSSAAVPAFAGNTSYSFSLKTTNSSIGSGATKDDSERTAYLKVSSMSKNVTTNFRVRSSSDSEVTFMQTVSKPSSSTYSLDYKPGKITVGDTYYIWANLQEKQSSYVSISGTWCP